MAGASIELEARAYGPQSSPEELEAIRRRVSLHGDAVLYQELPVTTVFTIDLCYDRVEELVDAHGCRALIVDVRDSSRPSAVVRKRITARVEALHGRVRHVAVVMKPNPLMMVATRFVQAAMSIPLSFHNTMAEAEEALRRVVD